MGSFLGDAVAAAATGAGGGDDSSCAESIGGLDREAGGEALVCMRGSGRTRSVCGDAREGAGGNEAGVRTMTVVIKGGEPPFGGANFALGALKWALEGGATRVPKTLFWILVASERVFWKRLFGGAGTLDQPWLFRFGGGRRSVSFT